ncbi:hypothetical protein NS330_06100 [Curtobacterium citreum]|nr:hypothetical protein NS330_06100 [Curtobacterium citreum]
MGAASPAIVGYGAVYRSVGWSPEVDRTSVSFAPPGSMTSVWSWSGEPVAALGCPESSRVGSPWSAVPWVASSAEP